MVWPLSVAVGNRWAWQFGIPISIAATMLLGSALYVLGAFAHFLLVFVAVAFLANAWAAFIDLPRLAEQRRHARQHRPKMLKGRRDPALIFAGLLVIAVAVLAYFSDAVTHVSPAAPDTANVWDYLNVISAGESTKGYPPGWFALVNPAFELLPGDVVWRFAGPSIGLLSLLGTFLLVRPIIGSWLGTAFVLVLVSPVAGPVFKWSFGFWPTGVTIFLVLAGTVALMDALDTLSPADASSSKSETFGKSAIAAGAIMAGVAVCSPLPAIQWTAAVLLGGLAVAFLCVRNRDVTAYVRFAGPPLAALSAVVLFFAYVSTGLQPGGYAPVSVPAAVVAPAPGAESDVTDPTTAAEDSGARSVVRAMLAVKFQGLLPGPLTLKAGAPLLVLAAFAALLVGWVKRRLDVVFLSSVLLVFAIVLQTGLLSLYGYTGRSAVYCAVLAILLGGVFLRWLFESRSAAFSDHRAGLVLGGVALLLLAITLISPPTWQRLLAPEAAYAVAEDLRNSRPAPVEISTNVNRLDLLPGVKSVPINPQSDQPDALVIDLEPSSALSQTASYELFYAGSPAADTGQVAELSRDEGGRMLGVALRNGWRVSKREGGVVLLEKR